MRYLDVRLPRRALTPVDVRQRAKMDQWLSVDQSYVAPYTRTLAVENVVRRAEGHEPDTAAVAQARSELAKTFVVLKSALEVQPFVAGKDRSIADISLLPYLAALTLFGAEDLLANCARLQKYQQRLTERPGYADVLTASRA